VEEGDGFLRHAAREEPPSDAEEEDFGNLGGKKKAVRKRTRATMPVFHIF
jgi:hypothetical protein